MRRGAIAKRNQRIEIASSIKSEAKREVAKISDRELWLIGVALYWAEGSKEKEHNIGQGVIFSNSDFSMIKVFLKWLKESIKIGEENIKYEIYIHENLRDEVRKVKQYWSMVTNAPLKEFKRIYFKKNKISTKRKNIAENYYGQLRIRVNKSTNLNRKIAGWIEGMIQSIL